MSDFDEFERQLNENKQGEGAGGAGQRAGLLLVSLRAPPPFSRRFPLSGPRGVPPTRLARLAHVTARRVSARGRGGDNGRGPVRMRAALSSAPHVVTAEVAWIGGIAWTLLLLAWEGEYVCKHSGFEVPPFLPLPRRFRFRPAHGLVLHAPFVPKWRLGDPPPPRGRWQVCVVGRSSSAAAFCAVSC